MVVQLIEEVRRAQGLTKKALAEQLGLTPRSLRNWMDRASCLQHTEVARLIEALEMSAEIGTNMYILTGQIPPAPPVGELLRTPEMDLYQDMIDDLTKCPSAVYSDCWDVVITNRAFREVFGRGAAPRHRPPHAQHPELHLPSTPTLPNSSAQATPRPSANNG
ncbi:helix-turn-helix domain-containing protein [Streptomyces sp. NBC_00885]|uniref:helix-turn-helix domain-containing protein n=1 Tax=Streptomyces sp. NBC_00885 TaxID=2975857 RepID=UPI003864FAA3|nr:helix-turn-helix domain-containing protein [Streptomyces sp. NBC_00885]